MKNIISLLFQPSVSGATAILSMTMAIATCTGAMTLASLRNSAYFNKKTRDLLADFGPTISIITCSVACLWLSNRYDIALGFLQLPNQIAPTTPRPWVVNLMETPVWARWASCLPAIMVSILMFFDQNITTRLVNSKDNKMKKGYGYHVDLLIVAFNTAVFSMLGMPWLVAATVRSVNHLRSLTTFETVKEGDVEQTKVVGVTENRVTNFGIHALIGLSIVYAKDLLRNIPQCVLMGLFLYLGLSAIKGNTFLERIELFFMDKKKMPVSSTHTERERERFHLQRTLTLHACLLCRLYIRTSHTSLTSLCRLPKSLRSFKLLPWLPLLCSRKADLASCSQWS